MNSFLNKLALGTVNFGMRYGISSHKRVGLDEIYQIISYLADNVSLTLDTSPEYGDSERILSELDLTDVGIISKVSPIKIKGVSETLKKLEKTVSLFDENLVGLLIHDADDVFSDSFSILTKELEQYRQYGIQIGVSVYSPAELEKVFDKLSPDIVQAPCNILDQRFIKPDVENLLKTHGSELHTRSCFLQGLLLMDERKIPESMSDSKRWIKKAKELSKHYSLDIQGLCLDFIFRSKLINKAVIGLENISQAEDLLKKINNIQFREALDCDGLECQDLSIIDPTRWAYG